MLRSLSWLGDSRKAVRAFSKTGRYRAGIELYALQRGASPTDWKPMRSIGPGACELRVHADNEYRVIYVVKFEEAVYVLHAFTKKTQQTSLLDVRLAQRRYREMMVRRKRQ